jgi:hypothetical protein
MPYIFEGNKLFYSRADAEPSRLEDHGARALRPTERNTPYRAYRLYMVDINLETGATGEEIPIESSPQNNVYCSPSAWRNQDRTVNLTYTKEDLVATRKPFYRARRRTGADFLSLGIPEDLPNILGLKNYCVADNAEYIAVASSYIGNAYILLYHKRRKSVKKIKFGLCSFLRRVSFESGSNRLLLTYPSNVFRGDGVFSGEYTTEILDVETLEILKIIAEDRSVYKSTIFGNKIIYTARGESGYSRSLKLCDFVTVPGRARAEIDFTMDLS